MLYGNVMTILLIVGLKKKAEYKWASIFVNSDYCGEM